jgi:hypothetical protein
MFWAFGLICLLAFSAPSKNVFEREKVSLYYRFPVELREIRRAVMLGTGGDHDDPLAGPCASEILSSPSMASHASHSYVC